MISQKQMVVNWHKFMKAKFDDVITAAMDSKGKPKWTEEETIKPIELGKER